VRLAISCIAGGLVLRAYAPVGRIKVAVKLSPLITENRFGQQRSVPISAMRIGMLIFVAST
jgi:hypothetical protein